MIANGTWGSCEWTISDDGVLTVYEGLAESISADGISPWYEYRESIRQAVFSGPVRFEENASLGCLLKDCVDLVSVDFSGLDTSGVSRMHSLLEGCASLEAVDLRPLDFSRVNTLSGLFNSCGSLKSIEMDGISTPHLINVIGMFMNCRSLETVDLSMLDTSGVVDMSWMFCGCESLKSVDLSALDTGKVIDMSCMFLSCTSLEKVVLSGVDFSNVMDASRMFMYCRALKCVDLSGADNRRMDLADDMFFGCDGLRALDPGESFSLMGSGNATILLPENAGEEEEDGGEEMVSDWRRSTEGVYYIPDTEFTVEYDPGVAEGEVLAVTRNAGETVVADLSEFKAPDGMVFKEWNTSRRGDGRAFRPGDEFPVHCDRILYAIWAGRPLIAEGVTLPVFTHGQGITLARPDIDPNGGEITDVVAQIQRPGDDRWRDIEEGETLTTADNGSRIRYKATNYVGTACSESLALRVDKGHYDMRQVRWELPEDLNYDGQEKVVELSGLPEGIHPVYTGNRGVEAGNYTASVIYQFDEDNYYPPEPPEPLKWKIGLGRYDMENIGWTYMEAFTYDGEAKSVRLEGLPEGTTPYYDGADAVDAGTYVATAGLDYDIDNYQRPDGIRSCIWEIKKTDHDMSRVSWGDEDCFVYDGGEKRVELSGLPDGVVAQYTGNQASKAGRYTARAAFVVMDPKNYRIPDPISFEWEIRKADHDMSRVHWSCNHFVYDGEEKTIRLEGLPEGVDVSYEGVSHRDAGGYQARAEILVSDLKNYNPIQPITCNWQIAKATVDLSRTRWNYSSPYVYNGQEKSVSLRNIPEGVRVTYEGNRAADAGEYVARAIFTYDRENYEPPVMENCLWEIKRAIPDTGSITWTYEEPFTYDGREHEVLLSNLPEDLAVRYEGNRATGAGSYSARAFLHPVDSANYADPEPLECRWDIRRAVFDISGIRWDEKERVYDGENKAILITNLPEGINARYEGNMASDAGDYRAKAVFEVADKENFLPPDPVEVDWSIGQRSLDLSGIRWDVPGSFTYDGQVKSVRLSGVPEGIEVRYENADAAEAGEYSAGAELITPEGSNFRDTRILNQVWTIEKADIDVSRVVWENPGRLVYDGREKEVRLLSLPDSLTPVYEGNREKDAGRHEARVRLIPKDEKNYREPAFAPLEWSIEKAIIDVGDVRWTDHSGFVYDGMPHRVVLENLPNGLRAEYDSNEAKDAGQYVATARLLPLDERNYETPSPIQHAWAIAKADFDTSAMKWSGETEFDYNGEVRRVALENVPDGLEVTYRGNEAKDAGQYMAAASLEPEDPENYNTPTVEPVPWEIRRADLDVSRVNWVSAERLIYDGTVKVVGLTGLPEDVKVEYENNVATDAGTYHASAVLSTDNKNYQAPQIRGCTWTIAKAVPDISGARWNYLIDYIYDGYEKTVELIDLPKGLRAVYEGNAAIEAGEYTAKARLIVEDEMNYEAPQVEDLHWSILKRDYDMSEAEWVSDGELIFDGTAKNVFLRGLEEGLEPIYEGNTAVEAGTYTATVRFLYDEDNYNPPEDMSHTWQIRKAPLDVSGVHWDYTGPFTAGKKVCTVSLMTESTGKGGLFRKNKDFRYVGLPEGTRVRYEGNTGKEAGVYEAKAYLTIPDDPEHEVTEPLTLVWEIIDG